MRIGVQWFIIFLKKDNEKKEELFTCIAHFNFNLPLYHILGACPANQLLQDLLKVHFPSEWIFPIFSLNVYNKNTTFKTYTDIYM